MKEAAKSSNARTLVGIVTSDKMDKTIVVSVERRERHPIYEKLVRRTTKIQAHDEKNQGQIGDKVRIKEYRPISKNKSWVLVDIIEKA